MTSTEGVSPDGADTLIGGVIAGNFRIERLIGSGAMGNVYQAEQLSLGKEVAVKVLHPHLMGDEKLVRRFQREAKSASRLNHPNSIQIIDSGRDAAGTLYIAMELLTGRDLSQIIRDEFPLPFPRIVRIMSQVFSALDEAHARGVIHRDLKPSNIMLIERRGEPDFVKVCDYGIAKAQLEEAEGEPQMLTLQGLVCGTPEYMSPEQARGEPLDGRADLYSAAVILYQLVTGDIPFRAATPIGIVSRHLSEAPVVPSARRPDPSIPATLDDLILRGLSKIRELRPATAAIFGEELQVIGSGRAGRRTRGAQETLPAVPAQPSGDERTSTSAARLPRHLGRSGKALTIGLVLATGMAGTTLAVLRHGRSAARFATQATATSPRAEAQAQAPTPPVAALAQVHTEARITPAIGGISTPVGAPFEAAPRPAGEGAADSSAAPRPARNRRPAAIAAQDRVPPRAQGGGRAERTTPTRGGADAAATVPPHPHPPAPIVAAQAVAVPSVDMGAPVLSSATTRAPRDVISEGEKLLSQGDVADACRRGEEAKKAAPRLAATYKFLGKCYMRAGDPGRAKDNYRRYLELAPDARDAMFIESIVK